MDDNLIYDYFYTKIIEFEGKRYPVVGQSETHYLCTEPWEEELGDAFYIPKDKSKVIK